MVEVNPSAEDGTTYVALLYGQKTGYTAEIASFSGRPDMAYPMEPPAGCSLAITNLERADSLPDVTSAFR